MLKNSKTVGEKVLYLSVFKFKQLWKDVLAMSCIAHEKYHIMPMPNAFKWLPQKTNMARKIE